MPVSAKPVNLSIEESFFTSASFANGSFLPILTEFKTSDFSEGF